MIESRECVQAARARLFVVTRHSELRARSMIRRLGGLQMLECALMRLLPAQPLGPFGVVAHVGDASEAGTRRRERLQ